MEDDDLFVEENDETLEMKFKKIGKWFSHNLSVIFAIIISAFFIFNGMVEIIPTKMAVKEQVIMAIINVFTGFSITSLISEHGFQSAKKNSAYIKEVNEYNAAVKEGLKYREGIENHARRKAEENLKNYRIRLLEGVGLRYDDIFDSYDHIDTSFDIRVYKNDKNYHRKIRVYHKAINVEVFSPNVFGRASSSTYGLKKEINEKTYRVKTSSTKMITKLIFGVVSVGAMLEWIGFTIGSLIYAFMQIVLWLGMGLIDSQKNFNFIMNEIMPQYTSNRLIIQEFMTLPDSEKQRYMPHKIPMIEMKENPVE